MVELPPNLDFSPLLFRKLTLHSFLVQSAVEFFNELVRSFTLFEFWYGQYICEPEIVTNTHHLSCI